ncbi:MAG: hypothetical protein FJW23_14610 [Acidimicrobiia bacterium]|nr:hypothetical protein [Acidimicrobiia bacterium]
MLAALFLAGSLGTGVELVLLEHLEDAWQWVPVVLLAAGCPAILWMVVRPGPLAVTLFRVLMVLFLAAGVIGISLHYGGNQEFALELTPDAEGWGLFWEAITGATPALSPGAMALLGALGLIVTYRHPGLAPPGHAALGSEGGTR